MNTFVNTTGKTNNTLAPLGLWAGFAPTTLQQPAPSKQENFSTVIGLTLASMLGGIGFASHELPPTFADTAKITTFSRLSVRNDYALFGYKISQSQHIAVNQYLHEHTTTRDFLREVAVIIDGIYGSRVTRDIHVIEDIDTGKPIMELTILSGLPLNDEFDQKDQLLFQQIEAARLAWGLCDVVITQG